MRVGDINMGSKKFYKDAKELIIFVIVVVASVLLVQSFVITSTKVQQHSMENTLIENDFLFAEKLSYRLTDPKLGDIIVFLQERPEGFKGNPLGITIDDIKNKFIKDEYNNKVPPRMRYVKRVIGLPGDIIDIREGIVYVNDKALDEPYIKGDPTDARTHLDYPVTVPEKQIFVLGDNRKASNDSRNFGCVDQSLIEGKVVLRLWPLNKIRVF